VVHTSSGSRSSSIIPCHRDRHDASSIGCHHDPGAKFWAGLDSIARRCHVPSFEAPPSTISLTPPGRLHYSIHRAPAVLGAPLGGWRWRRLPLLIVRSPHARMPAPWGRGVATWRDALHGTRRHGCATAAAESPPPESPNPSADDARNHHQPTTLQRDLFCSTPFRSIWHVAEPGTRHGDGDGDGVGAARVRRRVPFAGGIRLASPGSDHVPGPPSKSMDHGGRIRSG
jgi:hypothetical protein